MLSRKLNRQSHKIAFYIRVSSEEQAENPEGSIRNQEERLRESVRIKNSSEDFGTIEDIFIDRAYSGKNTQRPELQRMLQAIKRGEVTLVMVSELSRLSRSIKDFSEIWEMMQSCGCGFFSLRESFDTTNAAGEMVLYSLANIAQYERRQISERVSANMQARAKRGLFNGGKVPIGFQIDPERRGHLKADPEGVAVVRKAFEVFLRERSLASAARALNAKGERIPHRFSLDAHKGHETRFKALNVSNLHGILRSPSVAGLKRVRQDGKTAFVNAVWEPIVDVDTYERVQKLLDRNKGRYKPASFSHRTYELSGLVFCGQCGSALSGKSANGNGGKIPYYEHAWLTKRNGCLLKKAYDCGPFRVRAEILEEAVWRTVLDLLDNVDATISHFENAKTGSEMDTEKSALIRTKGELKETQNQIQLLSERLAQLPAGLDPKPIYAQMCRLQELERQQETALCGLKREARALEKFVSSDFYRTCLAEVQKRAVSSLDSTQRAKATQSLVQCVEIFPEGFKIHLKCFEGDFLEFGLFNHLSNHRPRKPGSHSLTNGEP